MNKNYKVERLLNGETFITKEFGNSMFPYIASEQEHKLEPVVWENCNVGDIVYCEAKGRFYTRFVKGKDTQRGLLIGNNRGNLNGWTKNVYGRVIEIL